ncbi:MAG: M50 family metallopeptidase [Methanocella sp.]
MSLRCILIIAIILVMIAQAVPGARSQGVPQVSITIDSKEMQACFGITNDSVIVLINSGPAVHLNHAMVFRGSGIDAIERGGFEEYIQNHPVDPELIFDDDTEDFFRIGTDDFDIILVGGPEHNAFTKRLLDQGILKYRETDLVGDGMVIEAATTPSGHTAVVIGSVAGYPPVASPQQADLTPVAAMAAGAGMGILGVYLAAFWSRAFEFLYGLITTYAGEVASEKETEIRKIHAGQVKKIAFLGYSWRELIVATSCLILFGIAFVIADGMALLPGNIMFYVVVGGFVVVSHDLGHRLVAYWLKVKAEFKFWGLGSATMLLTSWLFGLVFAQPSRVIVEKEKHNAEEMAAVMLAGPAVSLALSIIFLLMTPFGGPAGSIGLLGFSMNMVTVVYSLMPFDPMDGKSIFAWNRTYWAVLFIPITLLFVVATYVIV